jgi:hypothetical protein
MLGNQGFERVRQMFADQFEPDGKDYIYRKHMKGAPIQVSTSERNRYIASFNTYIKYGSWSIIGGTIILGVSLAFYAVETATDLSDIALYVGLGSITVAFMVGYYWAWNLPVRELRGRGTVGEARSRAEIKRLFLAKLTYSQIAAGAGTAVLLLIKVVWKEDSLSGWNLVWLILAAIILVMAAVQAFRKWRFDSARS